MILNFEFGILKFEVGLKRLLFLFLVSLSVSLSAQVVKSNTVGMHNGKKCYIHIVQPGQTVYSITKLYGVKEHEAILKSDIHHLSVDDTVWIPCTDCVVNSQVRARTEQSGGQQETKREYQFIVVEPGQTLYSLSKKYNVSIEDLNELNPELRTMGLKAGQTIKVPGAGRTGDNDSQVRARTEQSNSQQSVVNSQQPGASRTGSNGGRQPAAYTPKAPAEPAVVSPLIEPGRIHVSLLMPLHLGDLDKISTTKFDVDQRGKKSYGAFEYIQFYEGLLVGMERLERMNCKVVLNVVDITGKTRMDIETAINTHDVTRSDFIIALLPKEQFEYAADWAQKNQIFIINPLAERDEIVEGNPYVFKCMSSVDGEVNELLKIIGGMSGKPHLYIITSGSKNEARVRGLVEEKLKARGDIAYTFFDWSANSKLVATMKKTPNCYVLNIYDQNRDKNHIQVSTLLNRMAAAKSSGVTLVSFDNYILKYGDIDFAQLQQANYMTVNTELDYNDPSKKDFIDAFNEHFKVDPIGAYAPMANDIIIYFVYGLKNRGTEFWRSPNQSSVSGMLCPMFFSQSDRGHGFVNESAVFYKLSNLRFVPLSGRY